MVYGKDGMDEVSLGAATMVGELKDGQCASTRSTRGLRPEHDLQPRPEGGRRAGVQGHADGSVGNVAGTPREIVSLNAGTALYAANVASSIEDGIARAREAIASGAAREKLDQFVRATQQFQ